MCVAIKCISKKPYTRFSVKTSQLVRGDKKKKERCVFNQFKLMLTSSRATAASDRFHFSQQNKSMATHWEACFCSSAGPIVSSMTKNDEWLMWHHYDCKQPVCCGTRWLQSSTCTATPAFIFLCSIIQMWNKKKILHLNVTIELF